jgi:hypothetical protein
MERRENSLELRVESLEFRVLSPPRYESAASRRAESLEIYRKEIARNYQKFSSEIGLSSKRNDGNYYN